MESDAALAFSDTFVSLELGNILCSDVNDIIASDASSDTTILDQHERLATVARSRAQLDDVYSMRHHKHALFSLNIRGSHWILLRVKNISSTRKFSAIDPLVENAPVRCIDDKWEKHVGYDVRRLSAWIPQLDHLLTIYNGAPSLPSDCSLLVEPGAVQQNASDCDVITFLNMERLVRG